MDRQLKLAGHRIELDEVEGVLSRHPAVGSVAVIAAQAPNGGTELLAYVAPSSAKVSTDGQRDHVDRWGEVWDTAYSDAYAETDAPARDGKEFAGWLSSYTGKPIPVDEMRNWLQRTVERCASLGGQRIVDVGVGVGLLLRELAPRAQSYLGLDVSEKALRLIERSQITPGGPVVSLERGDALRLADLPDASADLVVFNSVIQYFPGADYLRRALHEAVRVAGPSGAVFVGDVRDLALLDAFHAHVQVHCAPASMDASAVAAAAERARADEHELCVAQNFFFDFATSEPTVGATCIELKRGHALNELTRFRFDVTLLGRDRAKHEAANGPHLTWSKETTFDAIRSFVASTPKDVSLVLRDLPNCRIVQPLAALRLLRESPGRQDSAWNLQRLLWEHDGADAVDPEDLAVLAAGHARRALLIPAKSGTVGHFDVVLPPIEQGTL
jgi:SAM-dependent methyltransferase